MSYSNCPSDAKHVLRSRFTLLFYCVVLFFCLLMPSQAAATVGESDLKAVFIYNFMHFVYGQGVTVEKDQREPYKIFVVGKTPIADALVKLEYQLRDSGKQEIRVTSYPSSNKDFDFSGCHLLFIGGSEQDDFKTILGRYKGKPILTVSDSDGFLEAGGMINLVVTDRNKIRWEINRIPLEGAGLRVSARILQIAVRVIDEPTSFLYDIIEEISA